MMDESDDDFKELCASFFQRVKKNGSKQASGERQTQKASNSTTIRSKLKKTKQSTTKNKTLQDPAEKKPQLGSRAQRTKKQGATKAQEREPAPPVNGEGRVPAPAPDQPVLCEGAQGIHTARTDAVNISPKRAPDGDSQPPPSCLTTALPSPSKPRAADLVLQRMQQFKRADPERLRHAAEECSLPATLEESVPESPREEVVGNGYGPRLPATDSDAAVALALQQEFGREGASACDELEGEGLFFCQMCQKDLSAMNVTRREQHVNRCLDEAEKVLKPSAPPIPECPICGKPFLTSKSRISHLKQCAVKMDVGPQLLLQAVRLQTAQTEAGGSPPAPSFVNQAGGLKRKGAAIRKESQKKRKVNKPEVPSEDLLVAMALSRSEMEQCPAAPALRLEDAFSERIKPGTEKKSRKKKPLLSPPQLLVQDSETTGRQIQDRVAQLLSEEVELSSTPPLPASRIFKEELEEAGWRLQPSEGKQNFLWEGSALTGAWAVESFYAAGLVPPIVPQQPTKGPGREPEPGVRRPPALHSSPRASSLSASQREHQALQDLVELAEEGLSANMARAAGLDLVPSSLPLTGFVLPPKEKLLERGDHATLSLGLLVADFSAMVNNPHLSDVQFQTDSGQVLYAHKFVLYARCPLLMQYVNNEGFSAVEDGDLAQRVLLSNVSAEAACTFLRHLYTADTGPGLPLHLVPDLSSLALRFGVSDLVHLCEQVPAGADSDGEQQEREDERCESRVENFQELLRSVWAGDEEEAEPLSKSEGHEEDRERVNEAEMEEIYEFAATQRKLLQGGSAADTDQDADERRGDSPSAGPTLASIQGNGQLEKAEPRGPAGLGEGEAPASWEDFKPSLLLPQGQRSDPVREPESCSPAGGCPLLLAEGHEPEQAFSLAPGEASELPQTAGSPKEWGGTVREPGVELACPSAPQQAPLPHPLCLLSPMSLTPSGRSPSRSRPPFHHTSDLSPVMSQSRGGGSRVATPGSPPPVVPSKQKRDSSILRLLPEPGHQQGKGWSSVSERKNKGVLISPEKSPPIDLTQPQPERSSPRPQHLPPHASGESEVILLLDSDEEPELEQTRARSVSDEPPEERKVLEFSPKSSELFSVIDVDADQEHSQSPARREAKLQLEDGEGRLESRGATGGRGTPWLFGDHESSLDEDDTADASWLVPATPLASSGRHSSSQTQITSLRTRTPREKAARHTPRAAQEAARKLSVIVPQTSSPVRPGTSDSGRRIYRSPSCPHSRKQELASPWALRPTAGGLPKFTGQCRALSLSGPCLQNQAAASEVVEVGDSEDEQEVASYQAKSSPLRDSDPPIPVDDGCWHVEPLSPIPIDHLNLERTGPLHTSSPSSRARQAPDGGDWCTTPIRGSCAARRRESQEQSEQSSRASPGSSRLSFLNPALWDDWDGEEQRSPEAAPAAQAPSAQEAPQSEEPETPKGATRKNLPPRVPITPMPRYSIMETPVLKRELDRFGVRPLPKRQMVLKLKEIFQYTHQTLESDSEDEIQSSQAPLEAPCSQTLPTDTYKPPRAGGHPQLEATAGPGSQRCKGPAKTKGARRRKQQPGESTQCPSKLPAAETPPGPDGDTQLSTSQASVATSVDSGDSSFSSQSSSSCEFGAALESAGEDEEGEEGVSASQAAIQAADTEEAMRHYIRSKPALYRKVLTYQPLELAELQAELRQDGIRVAAGKLLDVLDAHCITFTTAAARKEKLTQKGRRRRAGRKKGGRD